MSKELRNKDGLTEKEFLKQYRPGDYEKPSVTVDILLFAVDSELNNLKVLLIKRGDHPYMNCWALPGGFLEMDESTLTAAKRELKEETGLEGIHLEQLYTYTQPNRDPRMRVISIAYIALIPMKEAVAGDDAIDAKWFDITIDDSRFILTSQEKDVEIEYIMSEPCSKDKLAFDHNIIILDGITKIRNKYL